MWRVPEGEEWEGISYIDRIRIQRLLKNIDKKKVGKVHRIKRKMGLIKEEKVKMIRPPKRPWTREERHFENLKIIKKRYDKDPEFRKIVKASRTV
jgi:hypothetical protein